MQPKIHYPAVYFVRHGQTDYNLENRWMGQADQPLNQAGRNQIRALAESLKGGGVDVIISSPLQRAVQSAQILQNHLELASIKVYDWLAERALGELEGHKKQEEDRDRLDSIAGVEPADAFRQRIQQITRFFEQPRTTVIVSHSGVYRALLKSGIITVSPETVNLDNAQCVQVFPVI